MGRKQERKISTAYISSRWCKKRSRMSTFACRHDILCCTESARSVEQGEECGQSSEKAKKELGRFEARRDFLEEEKKEPFSLSWLFLTARRPPTLKCHKCQCWHSVHSRLVQHVPCGYSGYHKEREENPFSSPVNVGLQYTVVTVYSYIQSCPLPNSGQCFQKTQKCLSSYTPIPLMRPYPYFYRTVYQIWPCSHSFTQKYERAMFFPFRAWMTTLWICFYVVFNILYWTSPTLL